MKQKAHIYLDNDGRFVAECPECHERLFHPDLEIYMSCPFCGCVLDEDLDMEDFLMEPMVRNWLNKNSGNAQRQ